MREKIAGECVGTGGWVYDRRGETISQGRWNLAVGLRRVRKAQTVAEFRKWAIDVEKRLYRLEDQTRILLDPGY